MPAVVGWRQRQPAAAHPAAVPHTLTPLLCYGEPVNVIRNTSAIRVGLRINAGIRASGQELP
ncbi:MAG UNVERIFIED_CONTAM: hypothetical protein LVR29_10805 [Microcystis novacekii LVE1205-3]|jgi:hypothetical protein